MVLWSVHQVNDAVLQHGDGGDTSHLCVAVHALKEHHGIILVTTFPCLVFWVQGAATVAVYTCRFTNRIGAVFNYYLLFYGLRLLLTI